MQKQTIIPILFSSLVLLSANRLPPSAKEVFYHLPLESMHASPGPIIWPTLSLKISSSLFSIFSGTHVPVFERKHSNTIITLTNKRSYFTPVTKAQLVTQFYFNERYQEGFRELIRSNQPGAGIEYAAVFGIDVQTGLPRALPRISTWSGNSVSLNGNPAGLNVTAIAHTHPDNVFPAPSAGDLYAFGHYARSHPDFLYYILAANGDNYVLAVTDVERLNVFLENYPQHLQIAADSAGNAGRGAGYNPGSELYLSMQAYAAGLLSKSADPADPSPGELDAAHEAVQVYVLNHFNTGMTMFKQAKDGDFYPLYNVNGQTKSR